MFIETILILFRKKLTPLLSHATELRFFFYNIQIVEFFKIFRNLFESAHAYRTCLKSFIFICLNAVFRTSLCYSAKILNCLCIELHFSCTKMLVCFNSSFSDLHCIFFNKIWSRLKTYHTGSWSEHSRFHECEIAIQNQLQTVLFLRLTNTYT